MEDPNFNNQIIGVVLKNKYVIITKLGSGATLLYGYRMILSIKNI